MSLILPSFASFPDPPNDSPVELPYIELYGVDLKMHKLAVVLNQPAEGIEKKFLAVKTGDKQVYVTIDDLVDATGILEGRLIHKSPVELDRLIKNQNALLKQTVHVLDVAKRCFPTVLACDSDLSKFVINQLKGRKHPKEAIAKLSALVTKANLIRAAVFAGQTNSAYVGKIKGVGQQDLERVSLLISNGDVYVGADALGQGGTSKINRLQSLSTDSFRGAKAVARGQAKVDQLKRHLRMAKKLNQKGVPNITPVHRMKVITKTKAGEPKLVALISLMDGDAFSLTRLNVHPLHVTHVLVNVADALSAMHKLTIVHGDVKPENILLLGDVSIEPKVNEQERTLSSVKGKLHDFEGAGKIGKRIKSHTRRYLAPEVLKGSLVRLSIEQDLFAFGLTILAMAASSLSIDDQDRFFGLAVDQNEINQRIITLKVKLLRANLTSNAVMMRFLLVDVAGRLLQINPKDRILAEQASEQLVGVLEQGFNNEIQDLADPGYSDRLLQSLLGQPPTI